MNSLFVIAKEGRRLRQSISKFQMDHHVASLLRDDILWEFIASSMQALGLGLPSRNDKRCSSYLSTYQTTGWRSPFVTLTKPTGSPSLGATSTQCHGVQVRNTAVSIFEKPGG
jgi:hypothetical protein